MTDLTREFSSVLRAIAALGDEDYHRAIAAERELARREAGGAQS